MATLEPARVALITCRQIPERDQDEELLLGALREVGLHVQMLCWDDPSNDPADFDLAVLRSTWNYYQDPQAFLRWIERTDSVCRLRNPRSVVRWNLHKNYLRELQLAGFPVIPTHWVERGCSPALRPVLKQRRWEEIVIKPAISASSWGARRFSALNLSAAEDYLQDLARQHDAMVQQYLPSIEEEGEQALVWINGRLTHVVRKAPRFAGEAESVSAGRPPQSEETALAEAVLGRFAGHSDLLYGRVDLVRDRQGKHCISELELMEPSLFLAQSSTALDRFVDAIRCQALRAQRSSA